MGILILVPENIKRKFIRIIKRGFFFFQTFLIDNYTPSFMPARFENPVIVFQKRNFLQKVLCRDLATAFKSKCRKEGEKISSKKSIKGKFIYLFTSPLPLQ